MIGHKDRKEPLWHYCTGLLMPCERKSVEPMAAITALHRMAREGGKSRRATAVLFADLAAEQALGIGVGDVAS